MDYNKLLENIHQAILPYAQEGKAADYIPELAKVDPDQFGMYAPQFSQTNSSSITLKFCFSI